MSPVRFLADTDVLLKAAHWNLLDLVPSWAAVEWEEVATLPSVHYRANRGDPALFRGEDVAARLRAVLERTASLPEPDGEAVRELQGCPRIDAGEIQLLAVLVAQPEARLWTGDKRALRALHGERSTIGDRVRGRILSLEHFLLGAHEQLGAHELRGRLGAYGELDTVARAVLGPHATGGDRGIDEGLRSYLRDFERTCPGLLARTRGVAGGPV